MSRQAVIALDVGGTTVDAACVSADCALIGDLQGSSSPAAGTKDEIVEELARVIAAAGARAEGAEVIACGVAMPAPFDYAAGVSHMTHKFQAINGVALGELLMARTGLPVYFLNDADAFGLGVSWRQLPDAKRFVALTIGTGLGSGFIEDGAIAAADDRVPPGGEVWNMPFGDGIVEDYVSARGVVALYGGAQGAAKSAKEISALALNGDPRAIEAYRAMGAALGRGLAPVLARFAPQAVVIGGKVGQSLDLFRPAMLHALADAGLPHLQVLPAAAGNLAIWGAARHAFARTESFDLCHVRGRRLTVLAFAHFRRGRRIAMSNPAPRNVVLVHGGFVDGSGWQGVYESLTRDGFRVAVAQHPTLSLEADVEATKRIIDAQDGPVVLVGHSYGGAVITEAGTHPNVAALVYVCAFAPDKNESVNTLISGFPADGPQPPILPPKDGFLLLDRDKFHASFAGDLPADLAAFMADSQLPWGVEALGGVISDPGWRTKPSWYLVTAEDRMIPPSAQHTMASRIDATVSEVAASHSVYVSQPEAVARLVAQAAAGAAAR